MKKGFTLFEILLVISIIAVFITVAIPSYNKAREEIYDNQAKANLKLIYMAQKGYHIDTDSYYPPCPNAAAINSNCAVIPAYGLIDIVAPSGSYFSGITPSSTAVMYIQPGIVQSY